MFRSESSSFFFKKESDFECPQIVVFDGRHRIPNNHANISKLNIKRITDALRIESEKKTV